MSFNPFQRLHSCDTVLVNEKISILLSARTLLHNPGRAIQQHENLLAQLQYVLCRCLREWDWAMWRKVI